jgi:hypothetical protein
MFCFIAAFALLSETSLASTGNYTFTLLKQERPNITFVPYTAEQRQEVTNTMNSLMSIYVHREQKIAYYGKDFPEIDPVPRVRELGFQEFENWGTK